MIKSSGRSAPRKSHGLLDLLPKFRPSSIYAVLQTSSQEIIAESLNFGGKRPLADRPPPSAIDLRASLHNSLSHFLVCVPIARFVGREWAFPVLKLVWVEWRAAGRGEKKQRKKVFSLEDPFLH